MSCPLLQIPLALLNRSSIAKKKTEDDQAAEYKDDNNNNNNTNSNTHQKQMSKISALIFSPSSDAVYIGDTDGMLTKLSYHDSDDIHRSATTKTTRKYRREWKIDAQCGAIQGISTCCSSSSNSAESFVAVFGKGDCCVNVFHERHQSSPRNVLLRWQCTGHAFSVTAVQLVQLASSSLSTTDAIPLVVTASADGLIRLFDLQRTSTTSIATTTISGGGPRLTNNNNNNNYTTDHSKQQQQQQQHQQHQLVRSLCQTSLPHSLNVIPTMLLGKNDGTILVLCHEEENHNSNNDNDGSCSTRKEGGTSDGIVLIHIDVLGSQRHQQQQSHHHHFSSTSSSSSSLIQNTDLKKEVRSTSDLLQVSKIVKLRELFPSPFSGAANDNDDGSAIHFISWHNSSDNVIDLYDSRSENSIFSSCNFEREERHTKINLDESLHGLFTLIQHNSGSNSRRSGRTTVVDYIRACERTLLQECLFLDDNDDHDHADQNSKQKSLSSAVSGKTRSVKKPSASSSSVVTVKQIISGVIAQHHLSKQSGTRRERDEDDERQEKTSLSLVDVVERCKETLQLINELKSH